MRTVRPPAERLVVDGQIQFGTYAGPFRELNALDARLLGPLPLPKLVKASRLKEWQAFQFGNEDVYVNVALFNAKVLALAQVKIYDRRKREKYLFERKLAPWSLKLPNTLLDSECSYRGKGAWMCFTNRLDDGYIDLDIDIHESLDCPPLRARLRARHRDQDPLVVSIPFGKNHGMYSHKALLPVTGQLQVGSARHELTESTSYLLMDDHKGYYPFAMKWSWLAAGGHRAGRLIGLNLTKNQSIEPERFNENCLWLDGKRHLLPAVEFEHRVGDPEIWQVRDASGRVQLDFEIEMQSDLNINAVLLRSKYRGPFGHVSGTVSPEGGPSVAIDRLFGMAEDFYLRC